MFLRNQYQGAGRSLRVSLKWPFKLSVFPTHNLTLQKKKLRKERGSIFKDMLGKGLQDTDKQRLGAVADLFQLFQQAWRALAMQLLFTVLVKPWLGPRGYDAKARGIFDR